MPTRIPEALATLLVREGRRMQFSGGSLIQQQGDQGNGFWLIESGNVSVCRFGVDGRVTVFGVLGAGHLFGELAYFAEVARQVDAVANGDTAMIRIDAILIERLLTREPTFARELLRSLSHQLRTALDRIDHDRLQSAEQRICRALVDLTEREGPRITITQQALGELVGVSRVTAGQVVARLSEAGLLQPGYRWIEVRNVAALAALAN